MSKKVIDVRAKGDIIDLQVDGNGNIIGKDIYGNKIVIVNNIIQRDYGLTLIPPSYFQSHTHANLEQWKKGFSFSLESIKQEKEFRRENLLKEIKEQLEKHTRLIMVGESGFSKTTFLMEIICDYYDNGYKILYNFGSEEIKNSTHTGCRVGSVCDCR